MSEISSSSFSDPFFTPDQVAVFQAGLQETEFDRIEFLYADPIKLVMAIPEFRSHGYPDLRPWRQQARSAADTQMYREHPTMPLPRLRDPRHKSDTAPTRPRARRDEPVETREWLVGLSSAFRLVVAALKPAVQGHLLIAIPDLCKDPVSPRGDILHPLQGELGRFWQYQAGSNRLVYFPDRAYHRVVLLYLDPGRE